MPISYFLVPYLGKRLDTPAVEKLKEVQCF